MWTLFSLGVKVNLYLWPIHSKTRFKKKKYKIRFQRQDFLHMCAYVSPYVDTTPVEKALTANWLGNCSATIFKSEQVGFLAARRMSWTFLSPCSSRPLAKIPTRITPFSIRAWGSALSSWREKHRGGEEIRNHPSITDSQVQSWYSEWVSPKFNIHS